jgi:diguanylate cyclase (GGDEF)-like protein
MKKSQLFAIFGFFLGGGAPLGAMCLRFFLSHSPLPPFDFMKQEWAEHAFFYWYMLAGTCLVLTFVGFFLGRNEDESDLRNLQKVDQAIHDSLTGLATHRKMHELFAAQFKRHLDSQQPISCLMLDLDFFQKINEAYGHAFGDTVLKDFAQLLRNSVRQADIPSRYDGEEFFCIMPDCEERDARMVADRIRGETEKLVFPMGKTPVQITVSIGAVTVHDMRRLDYRFMIEESAKNLEEAKRQGRNRTVQTVFFDKATQGL